MSLEATSEVPAGFTADPQQQAQRAEQEDQKQSILKQILSAEALERLGRVKLVRQGKAEGLEVRLIQMAMKGELKSQITEAQLIQMLEAQTQQSQPKVKIQRRRALDDDDDDNDDDLM